MASAGAYEGARARDGEADGARDALRRGALDPGEANKYGGQHPLLRAGFVQAGVEDGEVRWLRIEGSTGLSICPSGVCAVRAKEEKRGGVGLVTLCVALGK